MSDKRSLEQLLLESIQSYKTTQTIRIAYSGGLDSSVLLYALNAIRLKLPNTITAIHVNHKLQNTADTWQHHCMDVCRKLNINLDVITIKAAPAANDSIEAWAREQRYAAFKDICDDNDIVLLAQHQNDQAETFLLQLMRGAGPQGLSAMPSIKKNEHYFIARPFLSIQRSDIKQYAEEHAIDWVEDISNTDLNFDRNYLRNKIIPLLESRWPMLSKTIARSSSHISEMFHEVKKKSDAALDSYIDADIDQINIKNLKTRPYTEQKNIIRSWIQYNAYQLPSDVILQQIIHSAMHCNEDKIPLVQWHTSQVRRYQDTLYIMPFYNETVQPAVNWKPNEILDLEYGVLSAKLSVGIGIKKELFDNRFVQVRFRQGGEKIQLPGKQNKQELKKLFQENKILPWVRDKIPLLYVDNVLCAVADLWIANDAISEPDEQAWIVSWQSNYKLYG